MNSGGLSFARDINSSAETISGLTDMNGSVLNSVFAGGELVIDQNLGTTDVSLFKIKSDVGSAKLKLEAATTYEVGSLISDDTGATGVLEKTGDGVLKLTNAANDYTGGTVVSAGTLEIASDSVLGPTSGSVTLNGGTLATTANMSSVRAVSLGASNGTVHTAGATTLTLSGDVSGSGSLSKTGAGTLSLTGTSTYSGGTTVSDGTLELNENTLQGDITNNARVKFSNTNTMDYSGDISGTGVFEKAGPGPVTLSGTNSYSGGTIVSGGVIAGQAGSALQGDIENNASVMFVQSDASTTKTYDGIMSGTGTLQKTGAGTLVVSGANTHAGGTSIIQGTLSIASDAALGEASGRLDIQGATLQTTANVTSSRNVTIATFDTDQAELNVAGSTEFALSGVVSSTGNLVKSGVGTLNLSGTNTYTGGTTVSAGTLEINSDQALGAASGDLALNGGTLATTTSFSSGRDLDVGSNGGTLETASGTELTLSGVISGASPVFNKTGSGTLTVTGTNNTYAGNTSVRAGTLDLDGSVASEVTVASGARIEGSGTAAGGLTSSGTVAPGNSPGTLSFAGDVTFTSGNTFITELDGLTYNVSGGAGSYDRLAITGATSTFTADGTIAPLLRGISAPANNNLNPVIGDAFRVVTTQNASGVSGAFSTVTDPTTDMPTNTRFDVLYGGNYVDLVLTPDDLSIFAAAYGIQNMVNAADAFDGIRPAQGTNGTTDNDTFFNGLYGLTAQETAVALLQASGEIHAFALSDARDTWNEGLGTVRSSSQRDGDHYWVDISGYNLNVDQDLFASAYDSKTRKLWIGSDVYKDQNTTYGFALGMSDSELNTVNSGSAETTTYSLAAYMRGVQGAFEYNGMASFNRSNVDTKRNVSLTTGSLENTSSSDVRGLAMSAQLGYRYDVAPSLVSGLAWIKGDLDNTRTDTFTEDGSTVSALAVNGYKVRSAKVSVGYTLSGKTSSSEVAAGLWSFGVGASKDVNSGMPDISRTVSLHGASWSVSVPKAGDVTKFVSGGLAIPLSNDAVAELSLTAAKRDGSLSKSAAFGFSAKW